MLFRLASIILIAGIQLVAAADAKSEFAPPDVLASTGDPDTTLQPYVGRKDTVNGTKLIRGLLVTRQSTCSAGYGPCIDYGCCPIDGECCLSGGGCCDAGYYCTVVSGQAGCCRTGRICTSSGGSSNGGDNSNSNPGQMNGAMDWKGSSSYFGLAPFLVSIAYVL